MQYRGVVLHHSACSSINGKGYDFYITRDAEIIPAHEPTDSVFIHVCLEGDFSEPIDETDERLIEQFFICQKLLVRLEQTLDLKPFQMNPHDEACPGKYFPWSKLVVSIKDGYH